MGAHWAEGVTGVPMVKVQGIEHYETLCFAHRLHTNQSTKGMEDASLCTVDPGSDWAACGAGDTNQAPRFHAVLDQLVWRQKPVCFLVWILLLFSLHLVHVSDEPRLQKRPGLVSSYFLGHL